MTFCTIIDKGIGSVLSKSGHGQSTGTTEKISDGVRNIFKKASCSLNYINVVPVLMVSLSWLMIAQQVTGKDVPIKDQQ